MLTREEIKKWLKSDHGMSRPELAAACGVSVSCVNNWLSVSQTNPIPFAKLQLIKSIIESREPTPPVETKAEVTAIALMLTSEQKTFLAQAAAKLGQPLEKFILNAGLERSEEILSGDSPPSPPSASASSKTSSPPESAPCLPTAKNWNPTPEPQ